MTKRVLAALAKLSVAWLVVYLVWPFTASVVWRIYFRRRRTLYGQKHRLSGLAE